MGSEWREVELQNVARELTVGYVGSMSSEYVESGIPFLRSKNVDVLNINTDDLKFISSEFNHKILKSSLSPGDVVIVRTGKPGTCAIIPDWLKDANCSDLVIVRCGPEINNRFLSYYVNTAAVSHVNAHLVGAVQQHFNVGSAKTMKVLLPSLVEQEKIVNVLGTLDDKIELNRQMNATLESMAQALFKSWFVDFDPVIDNALAVIPEQGILQYFDSQVYPWLKTIGKQEAINEILANVRDTLLPKLLSGQLRIPDAEKLIQEAV